MPEKKNVKFRNKLIIVVPLLVASLFSCDNSSVSSNDEIEPCQISNMYVDSLIFERDKANDSLLFEQIKDCQDLPHIVKLKFNLLIELKRFRRGLQYFNTLERENFNNTYDSIIYRTSFESKLTENEEVKIEMFKSVTKELEKYLVSTPLDTLALGNYCLNSLEYNTPEYVFEKIDSMAFANDYNSTYEFVIFVYLPDQYINYKKRILL